MSDGFLNKCKECSIKDASNNYKKLVSFADSKIKLMDYKKEYQANLRSKGLFNKPDNSRTDKFRNKHPEKYKCHTVVSNALRDGRIVKYCCEECGDDNTQAHHEDYSKPLEVTWLCVKHHADRDNQIRRNQIQLSLP